MRLLTTRWVPLFACLFLVPATVSSQRPSTAAPSDSALLAVLASVRPHWMTIRVDTGGLAPIQGLYAGLQDDALLVWPAPKRQVSLETIEALYARRSNVKRGTLIGAVAGGLFGGLILHNLGGTEETRIRSYAAGAVLGAFAGFGLSFGGGAWERIYIRAGSSDQ